jgi:hypothetical protein
MFRNPIHCSLWPMITTPNELSPIPALHVCHRTNHKQSFGILANRKLSQPVNNSAASQNPKLEPLAFEIILAPFRLDPNSVDNVVCVVM